MTRSPKVDGPSLVAHRKRAGLTQARLAEVAGITRSEMCHIEAGRRRPTPDALTRITTALGIAVDDVQSVEIPTLYTVAEAATALGVHEHTVIRWAKAKRIPAVKVGRRWRIPAAAVHAAATTGLEVAS